MKNIDVYGINLTEIENMNFSKHMANNNIAMNTYLPNERTLLVKEWLIAQLSPESQYVIKHFIDRKIQSRSFDTLDPRYNSQMIGLESAIEAGYLRIATKPMDPHHSYVKPTQKLLDLYF